MRTAARGLPAVLAAALAILPSQAMAGSPAVGHTRVAIFSGAHTADFSATPARDSVVILHEWERDKMFALKAANPGVTVLMYKNLAFMQERGSSGNASTGVTTQDATGHADWYLYDPAGSTLSPGSDPWLIAADVGNRGYQDKWASNAIAAVQGQWDGIFMDDTNATMKYHFDVAQIAKYPSDATYSAAVTSALANIGPKITAAGKLVIPNFGSWGSYRATVDPWLQYVSGGMEEQFAKWGQTADVGRVVGNGWKRQLGALQLAQSQGKLFLGIAHSVTTDASAARYGYATMLLGGEGRASYAMAYDYANEAPWFAEYDYDLGSPTGPVTSNAAGVYRRPFERGLVVVNPTTAAAAVDFGGGTYSGSGLSRAAGATMPSATGLVLLRDGAAPPPATPSPTPAATPSPTPAAVPAPVATPTPAPHKPPHRKRSAATRALTVRVACAARTATCHRRVTVKLRTRATVGRRTVRVRAGHVRQVAVGLTLRGRRALAARTPLKVLVSRVRRG